jgi:hypothetical protein
MWNSRRCGDFEERDHSQHLLPNCVCHFIRSKFDMSVPKRAVRLPPRLAHASPRSKKSFLVCAVVGHGLALPPTTGPYLEMGEIACCLASGVIKHIRNMTRVKKLSRLLSPFHVQVRAICTSMDVKTRRTYLVHTE